MSIKMSNIILLMFLKNDYVNNINRYTWVSVIHYVLYYIPCINQYRYYDIKIYDTINIILCKSFCILHTKNSKFMHLINKLNITIKPRPRKCII